MATYNKHFIFPQTKELEYFYIQRIYYSLEIDSVEQNNSIIKCIDKKKYPTLPGDPGTTSQSIEFTLAISPESFFGTYSPTPPLVQGIPKDPDLFEMLCQAEIEKHSEDQHNQIHELFLIFEYEIEGIITRKKVSALSIF